ncbi:hypothetical protein L210DRAFT_958150 [Boletus edulis BED1]|uniref:Non-ribosomal peptide synthetase n=1 Tax=Boletus edulis BED1 TaxID=1328754 RepID=A0AAD4C3Y3_BOLED|nr:hypothetical protein L210DRAFT_958150 [Boletus edulis BED1]
MSRPAHNDAEKGTLEVRSPQLAANPDLTKSEKMPVDLDVFPVQSLKKDAPPSNVAKPPAQPPKSQKIKISNWVHFIVWFNAYRRFFTFIIIVNFTGLGFAAAGLWPYALKYPGALVVGNLNFAILMRNEIFGRLLYLFVNTLFAKWTPLWFRLGCTSTLQHLGGIHSSCAISGIAWFILMVVNQFRYRQFYTSSLISFGVITIVMLLITLTAGLPWVRNTHHNVFERNHRFFGWTSLVMTWVYTILDNTFDISDGTYDRSGIYVIDQQSFWYTVGMTVLIVLPWICTRKVAVEIELPSPKVAILRFERGMQQGLLARVSRSAVWEYHAFGIISEGTHAKYHYLICGVQGDFTKSLVNDPPRKIWTRQLKVAGVSNTSTLYKRGIRICTGTGLGAALSTCIQSPYWYLIWIGSDQEKTFGPTISGLIHRHIGPERLLLWDSKERGGRPDTMKILKEAYDYWQAEVVFITSNYVGNFEIQHGCKALGIPAFGTLWDFVSLVDHLARGL